MHNQTVAIVCNQAAQGVVRFDLELFALFDSQARFIAVVEGVLLNFATRDLFH
jgi:hypothetical protein